MSEFTNEELGQIALILDMEEKKFKVKKKRQIWVHDIFLRRKDEGEYHTLFSALEDDELKFYKYFRMSKQQFFHLLHKIEGRITKKNTKFREAISAIEKLMVCIR